jgi:hypothetical protein
VGVAVGVGEAVGVGVGVGPATALVAHRTTAPRARMARSEKRTLVRIVFLCAPTVRRKLAPCPLRGASRRADGDAEIAHKLRVEEEVGTERGRCQRQ